MAYRRVSPVEGEWSKVIKAQDEISRQVMQEEIDLQRQSKIRYKEELDKQLLYKSHQLKNQQQDKNDEFSFHVAQQLAMKDFENKKKMQDRNHLMIIQNNNQNDLEKRQKMMNLMTEQEKNAEQERIRKTQQDLETERLRENFMKNKRIQDEQDEIRRQNQEKAQKARMASLEKQQDKKMIEKRIDQMKNAESGYREFYDKRMQELDQRMKNLQPVLDSAANRQELIRRRNEDWEKMMQEKIALQDQIDEENRIRNSLLLRNSLENQIEERQKQRFQEIETDKFYKKVAQSKAAEEENRKFYEREKRAREQEELKRVYEQQLVDKDREVMQNLSMNQAEKKIHSDLLNSLQQNKIVAFPGVPGSHSTESPIKKVFRKVYGQASDRSYDSFDRNKFSLTPPPFVEQAFENSYRKNYNFPDPYKHNPITNPIGAELPRVLPGERITRAPQSHSKLAMAGNNLFK
jgi:myosin heavy subunit